MFDKFGEFDSAEELNKAAEGLRNEGDRESLIELAKENGLSRQQLAEIMEQNRRELNGMLPSYSQLSGIRMVDNEFAKTPKKSIKRYLYADYDVTK